MKDECVDILMSTYNGEKYLREQIDSIVSQTHTNWKLIVRDDGSTDKTIDIINNYKQKYPEKIILIEDNRGNLGYKNSFFLLLFHTKSSYVMFADQDDCWHKSKIEVMLLEIIKREAKNKIEPYLVCCNLEICNENSKIIEPSYYKHVNLKPGRANESILLASQLHGCAFLFNKYLVDECKQLSDENILLSNFSLNGHDSFIAVICVIIGEVYLIEDVLVKHRIHNRNLVGFSESKKKSLLLQLKIVLKYIFKNKDYRTLLYDSKLLENSQIINSILTKRNSKISKEYTFFLNIDNSSYLERKWRNITTPFVNHYNFIEKLVYIACF